MTFRKKYDRINGYVTFIHGVMDIEMEIEKTEKITGGKTLHLKKVSLTRNQHKFLHAALTVTLMAALVLRPVRYPDRIGTAARRHSENSDSKGYHHADRRFDVPSDATAGRL